MFAEMKILFFISLLILSACASTISVNYAPSSIAFQGAGKVRVEAFKYQPAISGKVDADQIPNSAIGSIHLGQPLGNYVANAFASEFKLGGYQIGPGGLEITGNIQELKAGDLGFSVDWTLVLAVSLIKKDGKKLEKTVEVKKNTNKFGDLSSMFNPIIKEAFEKVVTAPEVKSFLK